MASLVIPHEQADCLGIERSSRLVHHQLNQRIALQLGVDASRGHLEAFHLLAPLAFQLVQSGVFQNDGQLHADGRQAGILCVPGQVAGGQVTGDPFLRMDGQAVFKLAVGVLDSVSRSVLAKAGRDPASVRWVIPHQANIRIMHSAARKLGLGSDRVIVTVDQHGNTSAASIPLALDTAVRDGRIVRGDSVLLQGVGGGFTWGAVLFDF